MINLDEELLNGVLKVVDLSFQLRPLVGGDGAADDGAAHAARAAQSLLPGSRTSSHVSLA